MPSSQSMHRGAELLLDHEEELMAAFFRVAARLCAVAPWDSVATGSHVVGLDAPGLGAAELCVSVLGHAGESFGMVIFEPLRAHRDLPGGASAAARGRPGLRCDTMAISFDAAEDLPPAIVQEAGRHGWALPQCGRYPTLLVVGRGGASRLHTRDDVVLAIAAADAAARFFEGRPRWTAAAGQPGASSLVLSSDPALA